jgi:SNF2 family DNA or RNA helicase
MTSSSSSSSSYIGLQGYSIPKSSISVNEQHAIRKELTVVAHVPKSPIQSTPFPIYRESPLKLYVPIHWGIMKFGAVPNKIKSAVQLNLQFAGQLRDYQDSIVEKYMHNVTQQGFGGGLLDVDPGKGKTVMALKIIQRLGVKTIIVVHKSFLSNQWRERIQQFLPDAKVGIIQGQVIDIENKDIVIAMVQSLSIK